MVIIWRYFKELYEKKYKDILLIHQNSINLNNKNIKTYPKIKTIKYLKIYKF